MDDGNKYSSRQDRIDGGNNVRYYPELIKSDLYDETLKSDEYKEYLKDMEKGD